MSALAAGKTRIYAWSEMAGSGPAMAHGHSHCHVAITDHGTQVYVPSFACIGKVDDLPLQPCSFSHEVSCHLLR